MPDNFKGLATGIGSLPHTDAQAAVDLVLRYLPQIPFWPQLPKRDIREGMVAQFSENLPYLSFGQEGLSFSPFSAKDGDLELFYERVIAGDVDYFKISPEYSSGLYKFYQKLENYDLKNIERIKCHITGPFTFGASLKDANGVALLHDAVFMQVILKGLAMKALWQIKLFRKFKKPLIVFIDEPYLGCFGSAYTPLNREEVVRGLSELAAAIKSEDVLLGVHCCGNTDWSLFTDVSGIDIINFDAFSFLDKFVLYADNLKGFFKRGGIACWGIVPTQEFSGKESAQQLAAKIAAGIDTLAKKGLDKGLLSNQLLVSPACGLGALETAKAEAILKLLADTSLRLRSQK